MKKVYSTAVTATGGRNGHVQSADNVLDADVRLPKSLGGTEDGHLNPEMLFAAAYAACFDNALMHVIRLEKVTAGTTTVTAEVHLLQLDGGKFGLAVKLLVDVPGVDRAMAEELVNKAHQVCPYSNATRGNIEVELEVK
ncbi:MAG: organic hydroperoxide resistance protein [Ferruginibacter sp.]|nr:organic hydroperoxide resistance protein [Ferruginibacter sp.]